MDKEPTSGDQGISPPSGLEDSQTPPASESAEDTDGATRTRLRWMIPIVTAAAVVVLIAAGLICWRMVSNREHTQAVERCSGAVARLEKPAGGADARTAHYQEAAGISSDQVKDVKTVIAMARAVKNAGGIKPQPVRCDASMTTGELKAAADKAEDLNGRNDKLNRAAKAVLASRDAKDLDDARTALAAKKEEASRLLGDSDGKVADNATREALQQAIGQAEQTKGGKAQAWRDAVGPLQSAIDQVNASMQAKTQADQQAAEEAAQQAAQAASQQQAQAVQQATPSYGGGYTPSYRPSHGQGGGGGGWSAPAPAAPSTPQGGGVSPDIDAWLHTITPSQCHAGGPCGIG